MKLRELIRELERYAQVDPDIEVVTGGIHRGGTLSFVVREVYTENSMLTGTRVLKISAHKKA